MKYLLLILALSGCSQIPQGYSGVSKPTETVYVRDVNGRTIARITDGNIYNTNGVRVGKISKR